MLDQVVTNALHLDPDEDELRHVPVIIRPGRFEFQTSHNLNPGHRDALAPGRVGESFREGRPKKQITLRLDPDVLDHFKQQGRGHQRNINTVLRR